MERNQPLHGKGGGSDAPTILGLHQTSSLFPPGSHHSNIQNQNISTFLSKSSLTFSALAAFLAFAAYQRAHGNQEVIQVYLVCFERKNSGLVSNTQAECLGRATAYLVNALSAVLVGGYATGIADAKFRNFADMMVVGGGWNWRSWWALVMTMIFVMGWGKVVGRSVTNVCLRLAGWALA